jgi:hypothetical protein
MFFQIENICERYQYWRERRLKLASTIASFDANHSRSKTDGIRIIVVWAGA